MDARERNDKEVEQFSNLKEHASLLSASFLRLGLDKKSERCHNCGTQLQFVAPISSLNDDTDYKLTEANFCRERLCPMCAKRRSLKIFGQVSSIVDHINPDQYEFLLLTLTVPNVPGNQLADKISEMQKAFNKLIHYKKFKNAVVGFFRALEVTYNRNKRSKSYDTFHPHYHVILLVPKDYFTSDLYIKRKDFLSMWQCAMQDPSITQVDIRKVSEKKDKKRGIISKAGAIAEVAKYTVKSSDYIFPNHPDLTDKVVGVLSAALKGRRLVAFGGVFADLKSSLGLDDPEDGDLIHIDPDETIENAPLYLVRRWVWDRQYCLRDECVETAVELKKRQEERKRAWLEWLKYVRRKKQAA